MSAGRFREYCFGFEYLFSKILPPPTAPRRKGRRDSAPVSRQKKNTNTESVGGGRAGKKAVCLWANWETENGRYVKTLIIWHTPPRGVFCGVKVLQYGPDCFRFKFRQEKWLAKEWPDCFGYKFKHENLLRSSCSRVLTGRQNWFRQIALLSCY